MTQARCYRFDDFTLDAANRSLLRAGSQVALNARYFDALVLLVREHGQLVSKQRFFDEVWGNTVVTDAALTQCIKEIRRQLGDEAGDPRFVRTVPGHGYCFIAPVSDGHERAPEARTSADPRDLAPTTDLADAAGLAIANPAPPAAVAEGSRQAGQPPAFTRWLLGGAAATLGGAVAGLAGGLLYGSALAFSPNSQALGSLSVLLVLLALHVLVGIAGALGVGFGLATGRLAGNGAGWLLAGGALGGLLVGGMARLVGSDAFTLLVGQAPAGITGGLEGAAIGLAVAAGLVLGGGPEAPDPRRPALLAALTTGLAGALVPLAGGSMMATSLARVAAAFDGSRLDMAPLGQLFGEPQLGLLAQSVLGAVEGAVFGGCVVAALLVARRHMPHG